MKQLNETVWHCSLRILAKHDSTLNNIITLRGLPPFWTRPATFETLVRIILEQQVSLDSALAVYGRISQSLTKVDAASILRAGAETMGQLGVTRPKQKALLDLSERISSGNLSLSQLTELDANEAMNALQQVKGIGPWSSSVYLLFALRFSDIWPSGDLALNRSLVENNCLPNNATDDERVEFTRRWSPFRAVAARILWHDYLCRRKRSCTF